MDGSKSRNRACHRRPVVEELEDRIILSYVHSPAAPAILPARPSLAGAPPASSPVASVENAGSYAAAFEPDPGTGKVGRHEYDYPALSLFNYRLDGGDRRGEPDADGAHDHQESLLRQMASAPFPQTTAQTADSALPPAVGKVDAGNILAALNPGTSLAGFVLPGKADVRATATPPGRVPTGVIREACVPSDNVADLLAPLTDSLTLFAEACHPEALAACAETLPAMLPALVAPVSFTLGELRQQVDHFFSHLAPSEETLDALAQATWVVPWLMLVSAVAFEFARQRDRAATPESCLPPTFPPVARS
jgi:hypothetical protein